MKTNLKLLSWNVNGIRAIDKKEALRWIDDFEVDILALQEIKATKEQIPQTLFEKEFQDLEVSSSAIKGRSGVACFYNPPASYTSQNLEIDILDEGRINELHFQIQNKEVVFFNIYFPNGQSKEERLVYKMEFYERFYEYCKKLLDSGKSLIVCGDVNTAHTSIDIARPKANEKTSGFLPMEREWIDGFLKLGFVDTFRYLHPTQKHRYSWWSYRANARANNVGWRIDYFYVSHDIKECIKDADILDTVLGSDHCPIYLELDFSNS